MSIDQETQTSFRQLGVASLGICARQKKHKQICTPSAQHRVAFYSKTKKGARHRLREGLKIQTSEKLKSIVARGARF